MEANSMHLGEALLTRRALLRGGLVLGTAAFFVPGVFAEELARTPRMTEGPYYPDRLPLDTDNDLLIINNSLTPAVGEITHLSGRVLSTSGEPIRNVVVEIWQCDANAVYLNSSDSVPKADQRDVNFQGFGRFTTDSKGQYRFRTIKPVPYPGRPAPHIHYKVKRGDRELLTSQIFISGHAGNKRDGVFHDVRDPFERELIQTEFKPLPGAKTGELAANFDIVIGLTPRDRDAER
jgi:protocatechuate 3,4-dioxygenase beta subunit